MAGVERRDGVWVRVRRGGGLLLTYAEIKMPLLPSDSTGLVAPWSGRLEGGREGVCVDLAPALLAQWLAWLDCFAPALLVFPVPLPRLPFPSAILFTK